MEIQTNFNFKVSTFVNYKCHIMKYPNWEANLDNWSITPLSYKNSLTQEIGYTLTYKVNNENAHKHITYKCDWYSDDDLFPYAIDTDVDIFLKNEDGVFQVHHIVKDYHHDIYVLDMTTSYTDKIAFVISCIKTTM